MRRTFVELISNFCAKDKNTILITPDMGFSLFEKLKDLYEGKQFFNVGVSEQNAIGIAAGLALCGKTVFVYSIIPFLVFRCFEQIRIDICYQNLPVILVGSGGGLSYGTLGPTHHSLEDIGVLKNLPINIYCPADPLEAKLCILKAYQDKCPAYIRLGRGNDQLIHKNENDIDINNGTFLTEGEDVLIVSYGNIVRSCYEAVEELKTKFGTNCALISFPYVSSLNEYKVKKLIDKWDKVVVVEEHNTNTGLSETFASLVTTFASTNKLKFKKIGPSQTFINIVGDQEFLRQKVNLDKEGLVKEILYFLKD